MSEATQAKPELKALKSTLNLPQTAFPMKANLPQNEPARLQAWQQSDLYAQIRAARAGQPKYILHDGPPYANGAIHLGHALNKCIKDFVVKTKTMAGFDAPYVPGWDCHGLPIEIKVDEQLGRKKLEMDPIAVRRACREYAQKYVDLQRSQFERIGVFGRWNDPYLTMSFGYEASIVETFYDFFEKKFVYKGLKPVYWCIHDCTALAEAEVEYDQHTSPSVYVRYKLTSDTAQIDPLLAGKKDLYTVIWTTTPWTLPASQAVAFNPQLEYVALACEGGTYLIAQALMSSVIAHCHLVSAKNPAEPASQADILAVFTGNHLERATFQHPFLDRSILGVTADYVTAEQGTGAVHTSPAHGVDDFYTGQRYHLPEIQYVDNAGRQRHTGTNGGGGVAQPYEDLTVFKSNPVIIELLKEKGALLSDTTFEHSYPHCWRCHNPVIVRATEQWFIGMETPMITDEGATTTFRQRALDEIKQVVWDPAWGEERISNMIATRPDWCISRQRIWGVPIAVFLCDKCGEPLNEPAVNKSIVDLFKKEGADAWYAHDVASLLPAGTACAACSHQEFRKEMDILDVWFESGSSWHAVLDLEPELHSPADLYTEGGDQHRGWFHSSLLTSVAVRNHAPYKMVATSGWTLDEQGRAFSKSLGNGVDPVDIAKRLGAEVIRLWVASVDFREDVAASENLMQRVSDNYRKLRNTLRFLLGNLHDFNPATDAIAFANLQPLDQYILARTAELDAKIRAAYDSFEFHRAYHALNEYVNTDLSALYLDVLKDRLYTFAPNHPGRRSAQTALWRIAETLTRLIAPILSFTADEVWALLPKVENRESSVHLALFPAMSEIIPGTTRKLEEDFDHLLTLRDEVLKVLEEERTAKTISNKPSETEIVLGWLNTLAEQPNPVFEQYKSILPELFGVAQVEISNAIITEGTVEKGAFYVQAKPAAGSKCERCWRFTEDVGHEANYPTVCLRCAEALEAIHFPPYEAPPNNATESQA
ncbi:isoleucine--tRNA ligase [Tunturibacter empetritectus]|uniref:Isoleucine--tRNA ligase n=1 Tax=Tunturiibacter lichenicola TaxID=2051959 RepID=A0A7W8JDD6_9BACT|nr:isoleucine--tRNA ligase [Edaphobacter lichenicola]MBB5345794.1 isoleucyl-tRNA synthetase [Edaphobacter lichenicola]